MVLTDADGRRVTGEGTDASGKNKSQVGYTLLSQEGKCVHIRTA